MAELFLAQEPPKPGIVVIKRILPYLNEEPEFVRMFLDEARIAAQLNHPNIVQVHELGMLDERIFIAMEFVSGADLRRLMAEEAKHSATVPYAVAARICAQVAAGLEHAHASKGVDGRPLELIHRDVSPQNVVIGFDGRVKLVDFGIAKAGAFVERSKPGIIKGKFLYLAPEQVSQEKLDHRADLFALGSMLYECTTGRAPFGRPSMEAILYAIRFEEPSPPHLIRGDYPLELSRIVMRCLAKDRNQRYQRASQIQADLEALLASGVLKQSDDVAAYISRLLGPEPERTLLHIPQQSKPEPRSERVATAMLAPRFALESSSSDSVVTPVSEENLPQAQALDPELGMDEEEGESTVEESTEGLSGLFSPLRRPGPPGVLGERRVGSALITPLAVPRKAAPPPFSGPSRQDTVTEQPALKLPPRPPAEEISGPTLSRRETLTEQQLGQGTLLEVPANLPPLVDASSHRPPSEPEQHSITEADDEEGEQTLPLNLAPSLVQPERETRSEPRPRPRPVVVHSPNTLALDRPRPRRPLLWAVLAAVAALAVGVGLAMHWESPPAPMPGSPDSQQPPLDATPSTPEATLPTSAGEVAPAPTPTQPSAAPSPMEGGQPAQGSLVGPALVIVRFKAPPGTQVWLEEEQEPLASLAEDLQVEAGTLTIHYRCAGSRRTAPLQTKEYTVEPTQERLTLAVPCRPGRGSR